MALYINTLRINTFYRHFYVVVIKDKIKRLHKTKTVANILNSQIVRSLIYYNNPRFDKH